MYAKGIVLTILASLLAVLMRTNAIPLRRDMQPQLDIEDPEYFLELIDQLSHPIPDGRRFHPDHRFVIPNANKRGIGIDLGLNRGYSGAQVAKALLGIEAANNPRGPGRRKRSLLNNENDTKSQTSEEDAKLWR